MNPERYNNPKREASSEDSELEGEQSKKKKKKQAEELAKLLAKEKESKEGPSGEKSERSFWQKILNEEPASEKPEKPTEKSKKDDLEEAEASDETESESGQNAENELAEELESSNENPELETLSDDEKLAVAKAYVEARLDELEAVGDAEEEPAEQLERLTLEDFLNMLKGRLDAFDAESNDKLDRPVNEAFHSATGNFDGPEQSNEEQPKEGAQEEAPETGASFPVSAQEFMHDQPVRLNESQPVSSTDVESPTKPAKEMISSDESYSREAHAQAKGVVAGALFGYLVGRRRGRIKTEKRLKSVQQKLEKQVVEVQSQIFSKEQEIKRLVKRQPEQNVVLAVKQRTEVVPAAPNTTKQAEARLQTTSQEVVVEKAEKPSAPSPEQPTAENENVASREELIKQSAKVKVGETNLRRVWEARLVDESGLRRLIAEHEAGHDVRRALASEFLAKELRFERDPYLRDKLGIEVIETGGSNNQSAGTETGQKGATTTADNEAPSKQSSNSDVDNKRRRGHRQPTAVSPILLFGLTLLTILLVLYAVWLTFNR